MRKHSDVEALGDLVDLPLLAILATHYQNGSSLLSPVWNEWANGGFEIYIVTGDVKSRHISANPNVSVVVAEQAPPYRSVEIRGTAIISKPASVHEDFRRLAIRYCGPELGPEVAKQYESLDLELLTVKPGSFRAWDFADEM